MRLITIFLLLVLMTGLSSAAWYPEPGKPVVQVLAAAESTDVDQVMVAAKNGFNSTTHFLMRSSGTGSSAFLAQPDVPRNIIATINTSTTGSLKLTGTDIAGVAITENLTWAGETGAKSSANAFKSITRVDGTCTTNTAQFTLGTGNLLGLRRTFPATTVVLGTAVNGALETTAPAMTYSTTVLSQNTIDTNAAPGGYVTKVCLVSF